MKIEPFLHHADSLANGGFCDDVFIEAGGLGAWLKARPECPSGCFGMLHRFKMALGVFTGKYDALQWGGGQ